MFYREGKKAVKACVSKKHFWEREGRNPRENKDIWYSLLPLAGGSLGSEFSRTQWLVVGRNLT